MTTDEAERAAMVWFCTPFLSSRAAIDALRGVITAANKAGFERGKREGIAHGVLVNGELHAELESLREAAEATLSADGRELFLARKALRELLKRGAHSTGWLANKPIVQWHIDHVWKRNNMDDLETKLEQHLTDGNLILRYFRFAHLPEHLQAHSRLWAELAVRVCETLKPSAERTVALRKLLEGKDAAVRAGLE